MFRMLAIALVVSLAMITWAPSAQSVLAFLSILPGASWGMLVVVGVGYLLIGRSRGI